MLYLFLQIIKNIILSENGGKYEFIKRIYER